MIKKIQDTGMTHTAVEPIDHGRIETARIETARRAAQRGGVIIFPARCMYGLGADALNEAAVEKIFAIKQRDCGKPILVLAKDMDAVQRLAAHIPQDAKTLARHFWPGDVTLVFDAKKGLPENLTAGGGKIGVRIPGHPLTAALVKALDSPLTGTSANISGAPGCRRISDIPAPIRRAADVVLDAGVLEGGVGSTVVDVTGSRPAVLREGVVLKKDIFSRL